MKDRIFVLILLPVILSLTVRKHDGGIFNFTANLLKEDPVLLINR